ncbi:hypothetical protein Hanom_Chr05g00398651 [Helianthus anomalus]
MQSRIGLFQTIPELLQILQAREVPFRPNRDPSPNLLRLITNEKRVINSLQSVVTMSTISRDERNPSHQKISHYWNSFLKRLPNEAINFYGNPIKPVTHLSRIPKELLFNDLS